MTIVLMLALGLYWCIQAYQDWQKKPVLITITTTGLPVEEVQIKYLCSTSYILLYTFFETNTRVQSIEHIKQYKTPAYGLCIVQGSGQKVSEGKKREKS